MKTVTPLTDQERFAPSQTTYWLLDLQSGTTTWRLSNRAIDVGAQDYAPCLVETPQWSASSLKSFGPGGLVVSKATVRVKLFTPGGEGLRNRLLLTKPREVTAKLRLLWTDPAATWVEADAVTLLQGVVVDWRLEPGAIVCEIEDSLLAQSEKRIGRRLTAAMLGGASAPSADDLASPLLGTTMPIVFGRHPERRLLEIHSGITAELVGALSTVKSIIPLDSVEGFPSSGNVQVGAELIQYAVIDAAARTLGTVAQPIVRLETPVHHLAGEPVRSVPASDFQWLVADHECVSVTDVTAEGRLLDPADWQSELRQIGSLQSQIVKMSRWPVDASASGAVSKVSIRTVTQAEVYLISGASTATDPEFAIDDKITSTSATLGPTNTDLLVLIEKDVGHQGKKLGTWAGTFVRVRYTADPTWLSLSRVMVRFVGPSVSVDIPLTRPSAGAGLIEFELDATAAIGETLGWDVFTAINTARIELIYEADAAETSSVLIHDVDVFVSYFPRLKADSPKTITATVEGWPDASDQLIENPADVIEVLLTDPRFADLDASRIDATSLAAIQSELDGLGYKFSGVLPERPKLGELIDDAAREAATWIQGGAESLRFFRAKSLPDLSTGTLLEKTKALDPELALDTTTPAEALANDCMTFVAATGDLEQTACPPGSASEGSPTERRLRWLNGTSPVALNDLVQRASAESTCPAATSTQVYPVGASVLEPGDTISAENESLSLGLVPGRVESVRTLRSSAVAIRMRGPAPGIACFEEDFQTFLRSFGFGAEMLACVAGSWAASFRRDGELRVSASIQESTTLSAGPFTAPVVFSAGSIYLSLPDGPDFVPFLEIRSDGTLVLDGIFAEAADLSALVPTACIETDSAAMKISPDEQAMGFEFQSAGSELSLAGKLLEEPIF